MVLWVLAPFIAFGLGFALTKLFDTIPGFASSGATGAIGHALVVVGGAASLTMGANDVSNATAVFLSTGFSGPFVAGLIGGFGLAVGVLTWGRPLLERVAFDVVRLDMPMATAAQFVQAMVVLTAVFFGYFTSMNQALIGAMAGAAFARGRETIDRKVILGILRGWIWPSPSRLTSELAGQSGLGGARPFSQLGAPVPDVAETSHRLADPSIILEIILDGSAPDIYVSSRSLELSN